jgi:hypothetical protein
MTSPTCAVTRKRIWVVKLNLRNFEGQVDQISQGKFDDNVLRHYRVLHKASKCLRAYSERRKFQIAGGEGIPQHLLCILLAFQLIFFGRTN